MFTKIRLYLQIRKFYKLFGSEVGESFITKLSDMTTDNVYDVLFDINEIREVSDNDAWLDQLQNKLMHFCSDSPKLLSTHTYSLTEVILTIILVATISVGFIVIAEVDAHTQVEIKPTPKVESTRYTAYGRYYTDGTVITNDGISYSYSTEVISDKAPTNHMPVWIGLDDNGTPADISDDIVLGLVYDVYTAIYDALETELSKEFELERTGNNIHIKEAIQ